MAITTVDGALAGMQYPRTIVKAVTGTMVAGRPFNLMYLAGTPAAMVIPTVGIGGAALTTYAGQLPFTNPSSGNTYLARFQGMATIAGTLVLADRLWHNNAISATSGSEQTFTSSVQIPARDVNGTNTGTGVFAAVEVQLATTTNTPTITLKYTNTVPTADKTITNITPTVAASPLGTLYLMGLAAGDLGIQKAQSLTLSGTWGAGTLGVVLYREIARLELTAANVPNALDALTSGFVRIYNDSVPFIFFIPSTTTTSNISGSVVWTQG